ncbi:MAG: hypothetical protein JNK29_08445, partial [Anaerolineales bacterium]|nr:hypothetical protein [Anaerolineales bacterium]
SGDSAALAAALRAAVEDEGRRADLLARQRAYAQAQSWASVAAQTRAVYEQALARRHPRGAA